MPNSTPTSVNARLQSEAVGCRYPSHRVALLRAIQKRCGDAWLSDVVRRALDNEIARAADQGLFELVDPVESHRS